MTQKKYGVTMLLAGDFRKTLPEVPRETRADEIKTYLKKICFVVFGENTYSRLIYQKYESKT